MTTDKQTDAHLRELCTWRIGGAAHSIIRPLSIAEFAHELKNLTVHKTQFHVLGKCSNVLFSSDGVVEPIVLTTELTACALLRDAPEGYSTFGDVPDGEGGEYVYIEAGAPNARLLALASDKGLTGAECLAGVPGSFGGAVAMNAESIVSALREDMWLALVTADGKVSIQAASELECAYRKCDLAGAYAVAALLFLRRDAPEEVRGRIKQRLDKRSIGQPLEWPSAGCVFRNPPGDYSGALLDRAGMKGLSRGDAVYSDKHANFILNLGNATSGDVLELMVLGKRAVQEAFGRCLVPEIKFIGSFPEETLTYLQQDMESSDGST